MSDSHRNELHHGSESPKHSRFQYQRKEPGGKGIDGPYGSRISNKIIQKSIFLLEKANKIVRFLRTGFRS